MTLQLIILLSFSIKCQLCCQLLLFSVKKKWTLVSTNRLFNLKFNAILFLTKTLVFFLETHRRIFFKRSTGKCISRILDCNGDWDRPRGNDEWLVLCNEWMLLFLLNTTLVTLNYSIVDYCECLTSWTFIFKVPLFAIILRLKTRSCGLRLNC